MSFNHSRLTIFGILCGYPGVKWISVEGTVDLETGRRCHQTTKADAVNGSALGRVGQRWEVSRGSQKSVSRCWSCSPRRGTRSARLSRNTPFSRVVVLSLSLSLSVSPFSPEVTTSTPASERKRGRYREENDVLQNVVTPKRRSEGRCCSGGGGGEDRRRSRPRSFRPVRSPFFHDATRPRGRRSHGGGGVGGDLPRPPLAK